ncbi:hypothetical protein BGZ52_005957 [Haplosporangium bisporale]|nr:hypothetical protein BGZ52_005957 [Haplosporangium bisporale]
MTKLSALLLLVPYFVASVAAQGQGTIGNSDCPQTYDPTHDYFSYSKVTVDNAALFKVDYKLNYKVVTNTANGGNKEYVLYQCGTPMPDRALFRNTTVFVEIPVKNAATIATTPLAFIELLGRRSALRAVDTENLITSPCVQYDLEQKKIVPLEDKNLTLRAEQFRAADVIFSTFGSEPGTENKTVVTSEVSDPGPLNRAEWLEFYSTFFNLEGPAQELTASINNNYNCFKAAAATAATKPVIAWTSYAAPSQFNNNTASWSFSGADYKRILSTDAGASFFNGTTSSIFTSAAEFAAALTTVDVLIDETFTGADMTAFLNNYKLTADADLKFLKNKAVYRQDGSVNPNDGRDWFASAVVMNDAVLQDVIRTVHPEVLPANVPFNWIRNIATGESKKVLTSADCKATDSNKPVMDRAIVCKDMKAGGSNAAAAKQVGAWTAALAVLAAAFAL